MGSDERFDRRVAEFKVRIFAKDYIRQRRDLPATIRLALENRSIERL